MLVVEGLDMRESSEELLRSIGCKLESPLTAVTERPEQMRRRGGERPSRDSPERGFDGLLCLDVIHVRLTTSQVTRSSSVFSCTCSCSSGRTKVRPDCS